MRYIGPLLSENKFPQIAHWLFSLYTFLLSTACNVPYFQLPLLFPEAQSTKTNQALHAFVPLFQALNNCSRLFSHEHQLTIATCFVLPIKAALIPAPSSSFHISKYWKQTTVNTFFTVDSANTKIVYRSNQDCPFPSILNKIRWAVATGDIYLCIQA